MYKIRYLVGGELFRKATRAHCPRVNESMKIKDQWVKVDSIQHLDDDGCDRYSIVEVFTTAINGGDGK